MNSEQKICKNKNCQKVLPTGYKHRYCEACRNVHIENAKRGAKAVGGTILSIGLLVIGGKNLPKK